MKKLLLSLFILLGLSQAIKAADDFDLRIIKVIEASEPAKNDLLGYSQQSVKIKIPSDDQELLITNTIPDNQAYAITAKAGKQYLASIEEDGEVYLTDYYREPVILALIFAFMVLVILLGGSRGFKAIISLILTGLAITYFLIPGIKAGLNPISLAVALSAFATATTMLLVAGWTKKSLAATIGTTGGVAIAGLIAMIVINIAPLSGLARTEAHILLANLHAINLDFQGILAAGIIIASLGASMDVSISIASSAQEIYEANPHQTKRELFAHTMNVGKDIMGTMVNTLILAYTGASIPLFLLLYSESGIRLINMEIIATELTSATVGSIGLVLAIPVTALVSSVLLKAKQA
ncbi:MAG: YibE/F family protein [Cyanobacteria bacterium]|nr:YibE/F family protein [Cyanobacteriota bacterium]MDA1020112.1 YibE/F family protein [Cyanobacteriota bacterium]